MTTKIHIDIIQLAQAKQYCEIVYTTQLGKTTSEKGIIRDIFSRNQHDFLILESGLPILISSVISVQNMGG